MNRFPWRVGLVLLVVAVSASVASAQDASIAGTVRDVNGGVLPGVTVVASSPALIEKTRAAVTDGGGQYRITSLVPGVYTVTFTLTGFSTLQRPDIEVKTEVT